MKVVYPICCGVDVHKTFLVATIITSQGIIPHYSKKRFSTFNKSILQFKQWLIENNCFDVCMESTGKYWVPIFNLLEDTIRTTVANPKWVRAVKGNKDDTKDSKWIGDLFRLGLVPGSYIPPKPIRILREYTRYRFKLVSCRSSEKNRFQNAFTICNVALDAVVSDMFGKSASSITDYLISSDSFNPEYCSSLLQRSLKKKAVTVVESIEGYQMTKEQKERIVLVRSHLEFIEQSIAKLDKKLDKLIEPYESAITLLCTIPGVDRASAITIISEIGTDMSQFANSKRLCCWAGLTPGNNESAGKKKSVRITRAGVYLKPALVQVAHAAVKSNISPYYRVKYERISKRRGKKRAIIAIARMILTAIYNMFVTGEEFNPSDLYKIDMPHEMVEKQKEKAVKQAAKLLISLGLIKETDISMV
ncbi:transposase [Desulfitobacterium dichloroeliminans LMG P-21439]|uniref:Transposase n=1 Tax=Desulfitobacterium dichloroeliminans (strain LMG P-21439 / DCA1) TaxID=871963 RepID=L0F9S6_DESDL|nr:IS110 family transposase [Desulfitobacterium dichloroeliminans]AGA70554.1 transposase [Desulfitobacterium dichloroeliminans LMG P-21439]AGA70772.1 transposase [Desulfitobacterium dichloroeliminans LMG P-21439]